jgi:hypothetical protein
MHRLPKSCRNPGEFAKVFLHQGALHKPPACKGLRRFFAPGRTEVKANATRIGIFGVPSNVIRLCQLSIALGNCARRKRSLFVKNRKKRRLLCMKRAIEATK